MESRKIVDYRLIVCSQESHENGSSIRIKFKGSRKEHMPESVYEHINLRVNNLLKHGFIPLCAPSVCFDSDGYMVISQAMVKYEEVKE